MQKGYPLAAKPVIMFGVILTWFAVLFQFYLMIVNRTLPLPATVIKFFSYFTILSNIAIALCFTSLRNVPGGFFTRPKVIAALCVYILVVFLVYNIVLRPLWTFTGPQWIVNELLHVVNPVYFLFFWFFLVPKPNLFWKEMLPWLWYPLIYIVYVLIRGAMVHDYPYPFVDVNKLGYAQVLQNSIWVCLLFVVIGLLFTALCRILASRSQAKAPNPHT